MSLLSSMVKGPSWGETFGQLGDPARWTKLPTYGQLIRADPPRATYCVCMCNGWSEVSLPSVDCYDHGDRIFYRTYAGACPKCQKVYFSMTPLPR